MKQPAKVVTALEVFQQANAFYMTIDHLNRTAPDRASFVPMMIPVGVLSAFACELFLKCIVHIETGNPPTKVHYLHDLFLKLSPGSQEKLEKWWESYIGERKEILDKEDAAFGYQRPRDLRSKLILGNDAFRLLRYVYEEGADFDFSLGNFPIGLRALILEMKPEWLDLGKPVVNKPHPVFVEGKSNTAQLSFARDAVIDNESSAFQWAARWGTDADDGGPSHSAE